MRPNLIIVPAGDSSLHVQWCTPIRPYDVWVVYYGEDAEVARKYQSCCDRFLVGKGQKFRLLLDVLMRFREDIAHYDYVWLPDDDLKFHNGSLDVSKMFRLVRELDADVFQPAIANALVDDGPIVGRFCSPGWEICQLVAGAKYHRVTAVEMMMFGFSKEAVQHYLLPACLLLRHSRTGWGIEQIISIMGEGAKGSNWKAYVLDCIPVIHTRPLGSNPEHNQRGQIDLKRLEFIIGDVSRKTIEVVK